MTDQSAPPRFGGSDTLPHTPGWTSAALAVRAVREISTPMLLQLQVADNGSIVIDFRHHAFECDTEMVRFPTEPASVTVQTQPIDPEAPPVFALPGQDLDALLWMMGLNSFAGGSASWLRPEDRYRLRRWPNLTGLSHSVDQMRMIALLANTFLSADELAESAQIEAAQAQRLINALSLMGILRVSAAAAGPAARAGAAANTGADAKVPGEKSLFQRLRERLGL